MRDKSRWLVLLGLFLSLSPGGNSFGALGDVVHTIYRAGAGYWGGLAWKDGYLYEVTTRWTEFRKRDPESGDNLEFYGYNPPDTPYACDIAYDFKRDCFWIADGYNGVCQMTTTSGSPLFQFTPSRYTFGVYWDPDIDRLWVTDHVQWEINKCRVDGTVEETIYPDIAPGGIIRLGNHFWVSRFGEIDETPMVYELNLDGAPTGRQFSLPQDSGNWWDVGGITFDGRYLWVKGGQNTATYQVDIEYGPSATPTPVPGSIPYVALSDSNDYNGDGTQDIGVFRRSEGMWAIFGLPRVYFGTGGDYPVSGDYDGDGTAEIGVFRPATGIWAIRDVTRVCFGRNYDLPVPGDYDGNGRCDLAVYRPSQMMWAIRGWSRIHYGASGDFPVPARFTRGLNEIVAVFRPANGFWSASGVGSTYFGAYGDFPVPADYTGAGLVQAAVFKRGDGLWAIRDGTREYFGQNGDIPAMADYNGDGMAEIAIVRGGAGYLWAVKGMGRVYYGQEGDVPLTAQIYVP